MVDEHVFDLLPGYALGVLDEQELLQVARHLPHCPLCRKELADYWTTVDRLALAGPLQSPPAGLREKILRRVGGQSRAGQARPEATPAGRVSPRGGTGWFGRLASHPLALVGAAAALLLLAFLTASNLWLWQQVNDLRASVPGGPARIVRLEGTPDAPQALGYLVVFPSETYGTLVVEDAPPLPEGYAYQLWLIRDGKRTSGGLFSVSREGYGTLEVWADAPLDSFPSYGVTVEPAGGSPGPTGEKVLGGDL